MKIVNMIKTVLKTVIFFVITIDCNGKEEIANTGMKLYGSQIVSKESQEILKNAWNNGDIEAGGNLIFSWALGLGIDQDIKNAVVHSNSLASSGATRAYTTLALLLNHNLTTENVPEEDLFFKVMSNYIFAAVKGDPLAQIIVSGHYESTGDCLSALFYVRKAASIALGSAIETDFDRKDFVSYVLPEDAPIPFETLPTQEKLQFLEHMAMKGNGDMALQAAAIHYGGYWGMERDIPKTIELLKIAVEGNNTFAMVWLGQLYLMGFMVNMDGQDVFNLLIKALDYGNYFAYSDIARFYLEGKGGVAKNVAIAEEYLIKGMESGNVEAFFQLGNLYDSKEFNNDTARAAEMWRIATTVGHIQSSWHLAEYYKQMIESPSLITTQDTSEPSDNDYVSSSYCEMALPLYRTVALSGEWKEIFKDAYSDYLAGRKSSALVKYLLLSDLGYNGAHLNAARILDEGSVDLYRSVNSLHVESFKIWSRLAHNGLPRSYVQIGNHYYYGKGIEKNLTLAVENYREAFEGGNAEGGFNYALALEWGQGCPQNLSKSRLVFNNSRALDENAMVPVFIALSLLESIDFINHYFGIDFHDKDFYTSIIFPSWDSIAIILLTLLIIACLYQRRRPL